MAELPPKRRQVVRLPRPKPADWPNQEVPEGAYFPPLFPLQPTDEIASHFCQLMCHWSKRCVTSLVLSRNLFTCPKPAEWPNQEVPERECFAPLVLLCILQIKPSVHLISVNSCVTSQTDVASA